MNCVVVTGAANGIGKSICQELAKRGVVTALWDQDKEGLDSLEEELCSNTVGMAKGYVVDITDHQQVSKVTSDVESDLGAISCLVNNAGVSAVPCLFKNGDIQKWTRIVNVNAMGTVNVTSVIFPLMASRKSGHLVNISSVCGKSASPNHAVYSGTKYFMEGFSEGLRREGLKDGVKVTVVRPGAVKTRLDAWVFTDQADPESKVINDQLLSPPNPDIPIDVGVEEVGKMVAEVICLPANVAINEVNIVSAGLPQ